jgi:phage repressor protein C with HTH and peptisase S24 domain
MTNRIKLIRGELKLTQEILARKLGVTKSAVSMIETDKAALSERNKNIIVQEFGVNPEWLETGRGPMFDPVSGGVSALGGASDRALPSQSVPMYDIQATAGLVPLFNDHYQFQPIDYIHIPNLPRCDGAVYVVGDSMYPLIKSGDIVLYKQISDIRDNILWGEMYLLSLDIEGEEYIMVKYIQRSEQPGFVKLVSQNKYHADKEVEIGRIRALALIKASIRMNSIK